VKRCSGFAVDCGCCFPFSDAVLLRIARNKLRVTDNNAAWAKIMLCFCVWSEDPTDQAVSAAAATRHPVNFSFALFHFGAKPAFQGRAWDVGLKRDGMFNTRKISASCLQQIIAAANAKTTDTDNVSSNKVIGNFFHGF